MPKQDSKAEAEEKTGPHPHPGNVSDLSGLVDHPPLRATKLTAQQGKGELIAPVTEKADGEKIGRIPGQKPRGKATNTFLYQVVVAPAGPNGDILAGPDTAAITACLAAGWRPVGEARVASVDNHPDGISKVVTWEIPCIEASSHDNRNEE